jgi:hypothetical protein
LPGLPTLSRFRAFCHDSDWPSYLPEGNWKAAAFTQAIGPRTLETREHLPGGTAHRFYGLESGDAA